MGIGSVLIKAADITKTYGTGSARVEALRGVSLEIKKGEYMAIMGPSGSGKSTLMHIVGCLDTPTTGRYIFKGEETSKLSDDKLARIRNKEVGFVFQTFNLLPRITVFQNVELPLIYSRIAHKNRKERVLEILDEVGLLNRKEHLSNELSGGEAQRVAIARALVSSPSILLADEPTGNLDSKTEAEILKVFNRLASSKENTIVIVTHDPQIARNAERLVRLKDGEIV